MSEHDDGDADHPDGGKALAEAAAATGRRVAVAESLTGGLLSSQIARLPSASDWFVGSVVAYAGSVKHDVLGVPDVPVVSETAARALADGVATLLGADVTIAVTGVGGPGSQDGVPAGTVWMALHDGTQTQARCRCFRGDPDEVVRQTCADAVDWLSHALDAGRDGGEAGAAVA